jgi:xanthine dehydrogenase accessory factor
MNSDMRALLRGWQAAGKPYALASVVGVEGSAPIEVGESIAVTADGRVEGSVSGGCVDAEIYALCQEVLTSGDIVLRRFESDPDDPFAPSLVCGGALDIEIRRVDPEPVSDESPEPIDDAKTAAEPEPEPDERPRMLIFGAVQFAAALVRVGRLLDYRVTVCDARPAFTTPERFPGADEVVIAWPHEYLAAAEVRPDTAICVLTHDARYDVPVLAVALRSPAEYVGAIGSRRTCAERTERLRATGVTDEEMARLRSPIGLDLGGRSPEQTALAIGAEIVALAHGGSGRPLRDTEGPLHRSPRTPAKSGC